MPRLTYTVNMYKIPTDSSLKHYFNTDLSKIEDYISFTNLSQPIIGKPIRVTANGMQTYIGNNIEAITPWDYTYLTVNLENSETDKEPRYIFSAFIDDIKYINSNVWEIYFTPDYIRMNNILSKISDAYVIRKSLDSNELNTNILVNEAHDGQFPHFTASKIDHQKQLGFSSYNVAVYYASPPDSSVEIPEVSALNIRYEDDPYSYSELSYPSSIKSTGNYTTKLYPYSDIGDIMFDYKTFQHPSNIIGAELRPAITASGNTLSTSLSTGLSFGSDLNSFLKRVDGNISIETSSGSISIPSYAVTNDFKVDYHDSLLKGAKPKIVLSGVRGNDPINGFSKYTLTLSNDRNISLFANLADSKFISSLNSINMKIKQFNNSINSKVNLLSESLSNRKSMMDIDKTNSTSNLNLHNTNENNNTKLSYDNTVKNIQLSYDENVSNTNINNELSKESVNNGNKLTIDNATDQYNNSMDLLEKNNDFTKEINKLNGIFGAISATGQNFGSLAGDYMKNMSSFSASIAAGTPKTNINPSSVNSFLLSELMKLLGVTFETLKLDEINDLVTGNNKSNSSQTFDVSKKILNRSNENNLKNLNISNTKTLNSMSTNNSITSKTNANNYDLAVTKLKNALSTELSTIENNYNTAIEKFNLEKKYNMDSISYELKSMELSFLSSFAALLDYKHTSTQITSGFATTALDQGFLNIYLTYYTVLDEELTNQTRFINQYGFYVNRVYDKLDLTKFKGFIQTRDYAYTGALSSNAKQPINSMLNNGVYINK